MVSAARVVVVLAVAVTVAGCGGSRRVVRPGAPNGLLDRVGDRGDLRFVNGEERDVRLVALGPNEILVSEGGAPWPASVSQLDSMAFTSRAGGAWKGVKYGALIGAAIGLVWGLSLADDDNRAGWAVGGTFIFSLGGVVLGAPIGAIAGTTTTYEFRR
jgi:hypothetical protein